MLGYFKSYPLFCPGHPVVFQLIHCPGFITTDHFEKLVFSLSVFRSKRIKCYILMCSSERAGLDSWVLEWHCFRGLKMAERNWKIQCQENLHIIWIFVWLCWQSGRNLLLDKSAVGLNILTLSDSILVKSVVLRYCTCSHVVFWTCCDILEGVANSVMRVSWQRQQHPLKHRRTSTRLNGITPQPTVNLISTSVGSSYLTDTVSIICFYDL
jgi:hypothetical protein